MNEAHMYQFRVYCNRSLIASFMTAHQQAAFIAARRLRCPGSHYGDYPA